VIAPEDASQFSIEILYNGNTRVCAIETKSALVSVVRYNVERNILACIDRPNSFDKNAQPFVDCKLDKRFDFSEKNNIIFILT